MSRIVETFAQLKATQRTALIPYVVVGQPELATTPQIVSALIEAGADLVELGVPFSDPLADGPVIQRATHEALLRGVTPHDCLRTAKQIRAQHPRTPLIFMGYYNPIMRFGVETYARACVAAGVDGLIVPDLPYEESDELASACATQGIDLIPLIAPTSNEQRIEQMAKAATGFIYCVSVVGVTGARGSLSTEVEALAQRIRRHTDLPLAIGFGISQRAQVQQVAAFADGAVVGSALVNVIAQAAKGREAEQAAMYWRALRV